MRIDDLATTFAQLVALLGEAGKDTTAAWFCALAEFLEIGAAGRPFGGCLRECARRYQAYDQKNARPDEAHSTIPSIFGQQDKVNPPLTECQA